MQGAYNSEAMHGDGQLKDGNLLSVQKVDKAVRAFQCSRPLQRRIVPSMENRVHSLGCLARYKRCTNTRCI